MRRILILAAILGTFLSTPSQVEASTLTYSLLYSGAALGNTATAKGTISFDSTVLPNVATSVLNVSAATLGVTAFSITVSGASAGNGTFGLADVTNWIWILSGPLNLNANLVGQAGFTDFNWCGSLFTGCTAPAPGGIATFTIAANAETGDQMLLTSMAPVPEPTTLVLFGTGLAAVVARRRFKR